MFRCNERYQVCAMHISHAKSVDALTQCVMVWQPLMRYVCVGMYHAHAYDRCTCGVHGATGSLLDEKGSNDFFNWGFKDHGHGGSPS